MSGQRILASVLRVLKIMDKFIAERTENAEMRKGLKKIRQKSETINNFSSANSVISAEKN
jgi:hypothetical protein